MSLVKFALLGLVFASLQSHAEMGDFYLDPNISIGFNSAQGTSVRFGLDLGMRINENFYAGVGGFYAAGENPTHDREIGGGPFLGYVYPLFDFLTLQLREDVDYVDVREPIVVGSLPVTAHETFYGIESSTSAGVHLSFTRNFGISGGYRMVVGLSNSDIARGRSGTYLGISIGF